jgi:hypothetical protein
MEGNREGVMYISRLSILFVLLLAGPVHAGEADVVGVKVYQSVDHSYQFEVSVHHDDEGWKHYADRWEVLAPDGAVLATRVLHHPHVDEQPFTRGLSGVRIPKEIRKVTVRAHDLVHGYGGKTMTVELPGS